MCIGLGCREGSGLGDSSEVCHRSQRRVFTSESEMTEDEKKKNVDEASNGKMPRKSDQKLPVIKD